MLAVNLIKLVPERQELELFRPSHSVQRLVEEIAESQHPQPRAPHRPLYLLVKHPPEQELLESPGPLHSVDGLIAPNTTSNAAES